MNVDKIEARYVGSLKGIQEFPFDLDWSETKVSLLGVILSGNEKEHYDLNFKKRILNMKNLLNSWKCRNLSLKSKITIVNTLALSSLLYLASVIHVPSIVFKEVKHIVVDFIWEIKTSKIAYDVLIQQTEEEGLELVDFEDKVKSLKVMWVKCLTKDEKERWMATPTVFYKPQNLSQHFLFNQDKIKMEPKFYEDIHKYWSELQSVEITKVNTILNQVIWNKRFITIPKNTI